MTNGQPLTIDGDPKAHHAAYAITFSNHDVYSLRTRSYEGDAWVVAKESDLGEVPPAVLVELYNRAAAADNAKLVNKFSSREVMHRRVWPVIELLARPVPAASEGDAAQETSTPDSQSENQPMNALERKKRASKRTNVAKKSTSTKRAAAKKPAAAGDASRPGRPSGMSGKTIHLKTKEDPTREGSARKQSWKILKDGMSFDDYIKKGGDTNHLRVFIAQGHLSVR